MIATPRSRPRRIGRLVAVLVVAVALLAVASCGTSSSDDAAVGSSSGPGDTVSEPATTPSATRCGEPADGPISFTYAQVPGVDPNLLSVDVYRPIEACRPAPVVFWVHGGSWMAGDKANEGTATKAVWAASQGWALVAVNYRLSTPGAGVMWPVHGQDVAAAVAATLDRSDELGLDPDRVALVGHSAGAHIVSMVALDPTLLADAGSDRSVVDCLVALDTEGYDLQQRMRTGSEVTDDVYDSVFGDDPAALDAASPLRVVERTGGPVPDTLVITRGTPARRAQATRFEEALRGAGGLVGEVDADGLSHPEVNAVLGTADDRVITPPVTALLRDCLAAG